MSPRFKGRSNKGDFRERQDHDQGQAGELMSRCSCRKLYVCAPSRRHERGLDLGRADSQHPGQLQSLQKSTTSLIRRHKSCTLHTCVCMCTWVRTHAPYVASCCIIQVGASSTHRLPPLIETPGTARWPSRYQPLAKYQYWIRCHWGTLDEDKSPHRQMMRDTETLSCLGCA